MTKLFSLCKYKVGRKAFIDIVKVDNELIPEDSEKGTILIKQGDALIKTDITFKEYIEQKFEREMGMSLDTFKQGFIIQGGE